MPPLWREGSWRGGDRNDPSPPIPPSFANWLRDTLRSCWWICCFCFCCCCNSSSYWPETRCRRTIPQGQKRNGKKPTSQAAAEKNGGTSDDHKQNISAQRLESILAPPPYKNAPVKTNGTSNVYRGRQHSACAGTGNTQMHSCWGVTQSPLSTWSGLHLRTCTVISPMRWSILLSGAFEKLFLWDIPRILPLLREQASWQPTRKVFLSKRGLVAQVGIRSSRIVFGIRVATLLG